MNIFINDKKVCVSSVVMDEVDTRDYPDFADACAIKAEFEDGTPLNEVELHALTEKHGNQLAHASLY